MPTSVERQFVLMRVEPEDIAEVLQPGGGLILDMAEPIDEYQDEWRLVSHDFTLTQDGVGLISLVFERPSLTE